MTLVESLILYMTTRHHLLQSTPFDKKNMVLFTPACKGWGYSHPPHRLGRGSSGHKACRCSTA